MRYSDLDFCSKTVLITGGAGFIGSSLAHHFQQHYPGCRVIVFDAFVLGHFRNLRGFTGECFAGDVASADDLRRLERYPIDYVFHQAAISDTTVTDQKLVVEVNTNAFVNVLDLARSKGAPVVYASSAGTYGNSPAPNRVGQGEEPENVYGFSKLMMDHTAARYREEHGLQIVGLRYFNVYGPRESAKGTTASMIWQLAQQLQAGKRPRLFRPGDQRRDFVYIEDVVQANLKALTPRTPGVYNVGSGEARTFNELLSIVADQLGIRVKPEYIDNPWAFYQNHTEADIASTREELGYEPRFSLEAGIAAYLPELRQPQAREAAA